MVKFMVRIMIGLGGILIAVIVQLFLFESETLRVWTSIQCPNRLNQAALDTSDVGALLNGGCAQKMVAIHYLPTQELCRVVWVK